MNTDAGSRMHILDWVESRGRKFPDSLNELILPTGASVGQNDFWMPRGRKDPKEALLSKPCEPLLPKELSAKLRKWWLKVNHPFANEPNWDLASTCTLDGRPGLVIVEAKAHTRELSRARKSLRRDASENSKKNHEHIKEAIHIAFQALGGNAAGVNISRDSHYQFSNRIAFAWKIASLGVPTVLIYLGFTGDEGIHDLGIPFRDDAHWQEAMRRHMEGIFPENMIEREINFGEASMWFLIRSLACARCSPKPGQREELR